MSSKRKKYAPKKFESRGFDDPKMTFLDRSGVKRSDSFCMVFESLLQSAAYIDLTDKQKTLYIVCASQFYGHRKPRRDYKEIPEFQDDDVFYLNWREIHEIYGMYSAGNHSRFYKDMQVLQEHGFVTQITSGKSQHKKSIWKFDWKWQTWKQS